MSYPSYVLLITEVPDWQMLLRFRVMGNKAILNVCLTVG